MPRRRPEEPLPITAEVFWGETLPADPDRAAAAETALAAWLEPELPEVPAALPRRLGAFPSWRGADDLHYVLEDIYRKAAESALHLLD